MTNDRKTAPGWPPQPTPNNAWPQQQQPSAPYPQQPTSPQPYGQQPYGQQAPYGQPPPYNQQPQYNRQPQYGQPYPPVHPQAPAPQTPVPVYAQPAPQVPPPQPYPSYPASYQASYDASHHGQQAYAGEPPASTGGPGWAGDTTKPPKAPSPPPLQKADRSSRRVRFIKLTYLHLFAAILTFAGLLRLLMTQPTLVAKVSVPLTTFALGGRWNWGVVLAAFMAISWVADYWASHSTSKATQYLGLLFYVVAESLIFVPLLAIVEWKTAAILARGGAEPHIVRDAAFVTLGIFTVLTFSVVISKKDFSFLRGGLAVASGAALSLIAMSLVFGFSLGLAFSVAMVLLAAGYMLYQTSQVLAHYNPGQHVAASLALFSSVALMFWYIIRIFLRSRD